MLVLAYLEARAEGDTDAAAEVRSFAEDPEIGRMLDLEDSESACRVAREPGRTPPKRRSKRDATRWMRRGSPECPTTRRTSVISNDELLARRSKQREDATEPLVGDFVLFPDPEAQDGVRRERIAHDWGEDLGVQTAPGGSIYLGDGYASFSGTLNPTIPTKSLRDTGEVRPGRFWFFSGDHARADNGIDVEAPCRVYRYEPQSQLHPTDKNRGTMNRPKTHTKARRMEVGQIERVGSSADGHVRYDYEDLGDEPVYLGAESVSATEYRLTEAEAENMLSGDATTPHQSAEDDVGEVAVEAKTINIGPEGIAFYKAMHHAAHEHDGEVETRLVRIRHQDDTCEWEARCVEACIPGTAEIVCASEIGPLDALHQLKASLALLGPPCRPYVTNIERFAFALDN